MKTVWLPVTDIRFLTSGPPFWTAEKLKGVLQGFGFVFEGPVDKKGFQEVALPPEWGHNKLPGDTPGTGFIYDEKNRARVEVRCKLPWGDMEEIYFMTLLGKPHSNDPREGW